MNPEFKVLTNVNESNLRQPIIQNRTFCCIVSKKKKKSQG